MSARRIPHYPFPLEAGATWERQEPPWQTQHRGAAGRGSVSSGRAGCGLPRSIGSSPTTSRPSRRSTTSGSPPLGPLAARHPLVLKLGDGRLRSDRYGFRTALRRLYYVLFDRQSNIWVMEVGAAGE